MFAAFFNFVTIFFSYFDRKYTYNMLIRITCPCVLYRLTPNFYIVKLVFTGVINFFSEKTQIVGTRENCLADAVLMCTHNLCFEQK